MQSITFFGGRIIAEVRVSNFGAAATHTTTPLHELRDPNNVKGRPFYFTHVSQQLSTFCLLEPWHVIRVVLFALAGAETNSTAPTAAVANINNPVIFKRPFIIFLRFSGVAFVLLHDHGLRPGYFSCVSYQLITVSIVSLKELKS